MDHQEVLDKYVDPAALKSTLINGFGIGNYETQVCRDASRKPLLMPNIVQRRKMDHKHQRPQAYRCAFVQSTWKQRLAKFLTKRSSKSRLSTEWHPTARVEADSHSEFRRVDSARVIETGSEWSC